MPSWSGPGATPSATSFASASRSPCSPAWYASCSCPGCCPCRGILDAEVALEDPGVRLELGGRPLVRNVTVVDDVGAARQRQGRGDVLLHQDDGLARLREVAAGPHEVLDDDRREALEGLVEQDDLRVAHQG